MYRERGREIIDENAASTTDGICIYVEERRWEPADKPHDSSCHFFLVFLAKLCEWELLVYHDRVMNGIQISRQLLLPRTFCGHVN